MSYSYRETPSGQQLARMGVPTWKLDDTHPQPMLVFYCPLPWCAVTQVIVCVEDDRTVCDDWGMHCPGCETALIFDAHDSEELQADRDADDRQRNR